MIDLFDWNEWRAEEERAQRTVVMAPADFSLNPDIKKPVKLHTNISKVKVELDGNRYKFSLTRRGLVVRRWHSRKAKTLSFSQLLDLSLEQRQLL